MLTLSLVIPSNNEESYIGRCLSAVLRSDLSSVAHGGEPAAEADKPRLEIIVVANGCTDDTAGVARSFTPAVEDRGWRLKIVELAEGNKLAALNAGDRTASGDILVYVDADVEMSPQLLPQISDALDRPEPTYASGNVTPSRANSWITRAYTRFWVKLPFVATGVPGCGVFAVNRPGRNRWDHFPQIISDDTFVRLTFAPQERLRVPAGYVFPLPEGFWRLVKVRRRQDKGVAQVGALFPHLLRNDDKHVLGLGNLLRMLLSDPVGFAVYASVALTVRLTPADSVDWSRGR